jgi:hypothetical protein
MMRKAMTSMIQDSAGDRVEMEMVGSSTVALYTPNYSSTSK